MHRFGVNKHYYWAETQSTFGSPRLARQDQINDSLNVGLSLSR